MMQDAIKKIRKDITIYSPFPEKVRLIAVTKGKNTTEIEKVLKIGIHDIGENRVQEAEEKLPFLTTPCTKHFIGHLQKNKVKTCIQLFDMIQSADSWELAEKINKEAGNLRKKMPILVQVNITQDAKKHGIPPEETENFLKKINSLPNLEVQGLMAIGREIATEEEWRSSFRSLAKLFKKIQDKNIPRIEMKHLSMGMSDDYKIALQEGATMIRIGRKIFRPNS